jgi:CxC4 like cysteine cluster associated with KDZ transposases
MQAPLPEINFSQLVDIGYDLGSIPADGFLRPDLSEGACACGKPWTVDSYRNSNGTGTSRLFGLTTWRKVTVQHLYCNSCHTINQYDGNEHGVLNLNNMDLFTHANLRWYCIQMATSALPFHAHWHTCVLHYGLGMLSKEDMKLFKGKRGAFRHAWVSYVQLQDIKYEQVLACKCPEGDNYEELVVDGITLGTRAQVR